LPVRTTFSNPVCSPASVRRRSAGITTGDEGAQLLCIGATPGKTYEPLPIVELGGPTGF